MQVAVDRRSGLAELGVGAGEFGFEAGVLVGGFGVGVVGGLFEEVVGVVGGDEGGGDGVFEVVGGYALAGAGSGAFGLAGATDVVAVEGVAAVRSGPDVGAAAGLTAQLPAEEVLGGGGPDGGGLGGSFVEEQLGSGEDALVDDRVVFAFVEVVAVGDLAEVDGVAQHAQHGLVGPQLPVAGSAAGVVEPVGEGGGAVAFLDVLGEDGLDDGGFVGVGDEGLGGRVEGVAVGAWPAEPLAAGGLAFEAFGDAVDEQPAFELGEDPEQ